MRRALAALALFSLGCTAEPAVSTADTSCFGTRVLSFRDLVGEVVIPSGEACESGTFQLVFTRGGDTLVTLTEERTGTVGFIGTSDVNGDGRGEFFVATYADDSSRAGTLYAYTEGTSGIERFALAPLTAEQREGYVGGDRFGFGGGDQLVRALPRGVAGDTAWFGYSHGQSRWESIERPSWVR